MPKTVQLSEKQLVKLMQAHQRVVTFEQELGKARQELQDRVELVFDAHGAPVEAHIDLQAGVLIWPEEPKSEEAQGEENGAVVEGAPADEGEATEAQA